MTGSVIDSETALQDKVRRVSAFVSREIRSGEVAEWPNALVLKTSVPQGTGSSNLPLSACVSCEKTGFFPVFFVGADCFSRGSDLALNGTEMHSFATFSGKQGGKTF